MSTDSFSRGLEGQQALLLRELQKAEGRPVSYAELQRAGVEYPASVVSELELSGVKIERRHRAAVALRPEPAPSPDPPGEATDAPSPAAGESPLETGWRPVRIYRRRAGQALLEAALAAPAWIAEKARRRHPGVRPPARLVASLAIAVVAAGALVVVILSELNGGSGRRPLEVANVKRVKTPARSAGRRSRAVISRTTQTAPPTTSSAQAAPRTTSIAQAAPPTTSTAQAAPPTTSTATQAPPPATSGQATQTPTTLTSPALATSLEAQGHQLLDSNPAAAVPVLKRAVSATGEQVGACVEATSQGCLTYAYALYDLGRALQLSGHPAAAVPILEQRLQIDNQRSTVAAELQLARQGVK